jgi:hypothetical protein
MHPFQDQVNRMWDLIKLKIKAQNNGYWLEAVDLSYILLEIELRLLLSSKASRIRAAPTEIVDKEYLITLAKLAKDKEYIDETLYQKIITFNKTRNDAIHGLAQGRIRYEELEKTCRGTSALLGEIQSRWLPIKYGKIETREENLK